jgi:hypothetical protein
MIHSVPLNLYIFRSHENKWQILQPLVLVIEKYRYRDNFADNIDILTFKKGTFGSKIEEI